MRIMLASFCLLVTVFGLSKAAAAPVRPRSLVVLKDIADFPRVSAGTIVVMKKEFALYMILKNGQALRYPVAIAKSGQEWSGWARIQSVHRRPPWSPPAVVRAANPSMKEYFAPYPQDPNNPMGEAAFLLDRDQYAIHGTTEKTRSSIGKKASFGCVRMLNEDILDLWSYIGVGTPVLVM